MQCCSVVFCEVTCDNMSDTEKRETVGESGGKGAKWECVLTIPLYIFQVERGGEGGLAS